MQKMSKLRIIKVALLSMLFLFFTIAAFAEEIFTFDPDHTYIVWSVNHFGFSEVSGKFLAEGTLTFDPAKPQDSKVNLSIPANSLATGIKKLDNTLKGKTFFDVAQYPTASFVSNKIIITGKNAGKLYGILTIRNISKPIILTVHLNRSGEHPYYHKKAMGFSAITALKRSDFNMLGYIPGVSDDVNLQIQAEAISKFKPKEPTDSD